MWESALVKGQVLTQKTLDRMWTPTTLTTGETTDYGLGWVVELPARRGGFTRLGHGGLIAGFSCEYSRFIGPDSTLTVILLTNAELSRDEPYHMAGEVASHFLPRATAPGKAAPPPVSRRMQRARR